jgi:hypothetical protein
MQRRITTRMNSAFHFKLGFMIGMDGGKPAANGVDRCAVAKKIDGFAVANISVWIAAAGHKFAPTRARWH